jgi:hypothetical protein
MAEQEKAKKTIRQSTSKPQFKNSFDKLRKLFFSPKAFFEGVAWETDYLAPLLYFVIIMVIAQFINVLLSIPSTLQQPLGVIAVIFSFFGIAVGAAIGFVVPFISAGINHLGVLMFGGRKGYYNTFKPTTYAMVIGVVYGLILGIANFILSIVQPFNPASSIPTSFSDFISIIPGSYIAVNVLIYLASMIHTICAEVIGISRFQEMSKAKAFFAVIVMMLIMLVIIATVTILAFKFVSTLMPAPVV